MILILFHFYYSLDEFCDVMQYFKLFHVVSWVNHFIKMESICLLLSPISIPFWPIPGHQLKEIHQTFLEVFLISLSLTLALTIFNL